MVGKIKCIIERMTKGEKCIAYGAIPLAQMIAEKKDNVPYIITISGKARHGKDTFADMLKSNLVNEGNKVAIFHYADLLKMICTNYFDWDGNKDENGRHLLQYVGTDIVRAKNPDFWIIMANSIITTVLSDFDYIIIPDARFENEIDFWRELYPAHFCMAIRVIRTGFESELTGEQKQHISETALDQYNFDYYVEAADLSELKFASSLITEEIIKWIV